jgi:tetratricopeptide (TPR) repeat protein
MHNDSKEAEGKIRELSLAVARTEKRLQTTTPARARRTLEHRLASLRYQLADEFTELGEYARALQLYESLPPDACGEERYLGITKVLIESERFEEARQLLEEALDEFPDSPYLLNNYGLLFYRTEDNYEALRHFDRALECGDEKCNRAALYNKGLALSGLHCYEEAAKVLSDLMEKHPDDPWYAYERAHCELERGNLWEAMQLFRRCGEMGFLIPGVYGGHCCAFMRAGLLMEALAVARAGVDKHPDVEGMYENLGEVYILLESYGDAKELLSAGIERFPDSDVLKDLLRRAETEGTEGSEERRRGIVDRRAKKSHADGQDLLNRLVKDKGTTWN